MRDPVKQAWVDGKCMPQPFHTLLERLRLDGPPGAGIARKLYIRCTDPPLAYMRRFYAWASGVPGWQVTELATGHDAMVTEPEALARILAGWVAG